MLLKLNWGAMRSASNSLGLQHLSQWEELTDDMKSNEEFLKA
eukprot:gene47439-63591_t